MALSSASTAGFKHVRVCRVNTSVIGNPCSITGVVTLAEVLKRRRESMKLSQAALAKKARVSQSAVGNLESGARGASGRVPSTLPAIAAALDSTTEDLLREAGMQSAAGLSTQPNTKELVRTVIDPSQAQPESLRPGEMWLPQYEGVGAMMGSGSEGASAEVVTLVRVTEEGLRRRLIRTTFTSLSNLRLISAYGDSMAGTFEDGDVLLVDTGVRAIDRDGVYVYSRDGELQVKRLQREDDGSLTVISDNPRYRDRRIAREDKAVYQVHGRALLAWSARVL